MSERRVFLTGWSGAASNFVYLERGEWTVGARLDLAAHVLPDALAAYLIQTDQATVIEWTPPVSAPDAVGGTVPETIDLTEAAATVDQVRVDRSGPRPDVPVEIHDTPASDAVAPGIPDELAPSGQPLEEFTEDLHLKPRRSRKS